MDDKTLTIISLAIIITGLAAFVIFYTDEFPSRLVSEAQNGEGIKGAYFGRVDYVIQNNPTTIFTLTNDTSIIVFYPHETQFVKNDFVIVYAESQKYKDTNKNELFAYKVVEKK